MNGVDGTIWKIRPAGRHILTIGRDLIQDRFSAIAELVKNAYDADSRLVEIEFSVNPKDKEYSIRVSDFGIGMSYETVTGKWLVPSTDDKVVNKTSPKGRVFQGKKGVGRYAASILGDQLFLDTTAEGQRTTLLLSWEQFEKAKYLDDVDIQVETSKSNQPSGTTIICTGKIDTLAEWGATQEWIKALKKELMKLISPFGFPGRPDDDTFAIELLVDPFWSEGEDLSGQIEPFPLFDLFDYRIFGKIAKDGDGEFQFEVQKELGKPSEIIREKFESAQCGEVNFDIRVFDREPAAIESLIRRGLKDSTGKYLGRLEARRLLNENNGIGVYRNGFRIRPLGDPEYDWLKLNAQRVQNPSMRIGCNQAIGYVLIKSEEESGIIEKSARDGLKDNIAFDSLKTCTTRVIGLLEERRYLYRKNAGLSRKSLKVEKQLEELFDYSELTNNVKKSLLDARVSEQVSTSIVELIEDEKREKNKIAQDLREEIARYQGQATLGKIIRYVMHEASRPLSFFRNETTSISRLIKRSIETLSAEKALEIEESCNLIDDNAKSLLRIFQKITPLAAGRLDPISEIEFVSEIQKVFAIFKEGESASNVVLNVWAEQGAKIQFRRHDFYTLFSNLFDNSLYWLASSAQKKIEISVQVENGRIECVDFVDSGPGIKPEYIKTGVIFEPDFTTKPSEIGSGIGLSIAGEAANRSGYELSAIEYKLGAYFRIALKTGSE